MIDAILLSQLTWLNYSVIFVGGMSATAGWFNKRYGRRSGLEYQIAVTALSNIIYN